MNKKITTAIPPYHLKEVLRIFVMVTNIRKHITVDSDVQNGQPVFTGTRVPVQSLFWHLEKGITIEEFLEDFPSVSKEQAIGVLEIANKIVNSAQLDKIYETVD